MSVYHEFYHWSPILGSAAVRISMADSHGAEHFVIIPVEFGKKLREMRTLALDAIAANISTGKPPGEVKLPEKLLEKLQAPSD